MFRIAWSLLAGLILSWFGFDHVVIQGMLEVFNQTITSTGYYFLFGLMGALQSIGAWFGFGIKAKKTQWSDVKDAWNKTKQTK
ncbi:hypothetical protein AB3N02_22705 [Priestia aryabhattai]|jgi:hypothetical protein|uniref:hypothetical protein n=1 Tax=Priestia aryabhattai TaxID=412384 RepID=UPI0039A38208